MATIIRYSNRDFEAAVEMERRFNYYLKHLSVSQIREGIIGLLKRVDANCSFVGTGGVYIAVHEVYEYRGDTVVEVDILFDTSCFADVLGLPDDEIQITDIVIDLDTGKFEAYTGFNKTPLAESDRLYSFTDTDSEYHPVKLVKTYDLNNLPSTQTFVKDLENVESEDEVEDEPNCKP
jgi:hypothetical protein